MSEVAAAHPFVPHSRIAQIQGPVIVHLLELLPLGGAQRLRLVVMELVVVDSVGRATHPPLSEEVNCPDASVLLTFPKS